MQQGISATTGSCLPGHCWRAATEAVLEGDELSGTHTAMLQKLCLPSFPFAPAPSGRHRDSFLSTPQVASWEGRGKDRRHRDPTEVRNQALG